MMSLVSALDLRLITSGAPSYTQVSSSCVPIQIHREIYINVVWRVEELFHEAAVEHLHETVRASMAVDGTSKCCVSSIPARSRPVEIPRLANVPAEQHHVVASVSLCDEIASVAATLVMRHAETKRAT